MADCLITAGFKRPIDPPPLNKTKSPMAHFKAKVTKGKHKTQPFTVTVDKRVDTKVKQRYKTQYSAERGALRQFREVIMKDGLCLDKGVRIELPGGRWRMAFYWGDGGMHFNPIVTPKAKRK